MTAYNVVRFRVKPGMEDKFVASQKAALGRRRCPARSMPR